eukprot:746110-Hanusia_phi.AAC.1
MVKSTDYSVKVRGGGGGEGGGGGGGEGGRGGGGEGGGGGRGEGGGGEGGRGRKRRTTMKWEEVWGEQEQEQEVRREDQEQEQGQGHELVNNVSGPLERVSRGKVDFAVKHCESHERAEARRSSEGCGSG